MAGSTVKLPAMCGICGVIGSANSELAELRARRMMAALVHRGPDDEGLLARPRAVLGMRRLSIIDLEGGRQPVDNEDGTVGVVFNGEIYNFPELHATLESHGHRFRTRSDTEVIVHAYEEWGEGCLERLRGMFALALWDGRAGAAGETVGRVLLARDRLGIKPLYYAFVDGALLFASEVRALLASGAIARRIAPQSVEAYLYFGSVVEPMTLVQGVLSLPPGHALLASCDAPLQGKPSGAIGTLPLRRAESLERRPRVWRRRLGRFARCSRRRCAATCWLMCRSGCF